MFKFNSRKISKKNNRGFTVVESLVAILILVLSITGPMAFSQSGLRASFVSRDQITAFYLAQDAVEFIKNWRDSNVLNRKSWNHNFFNLCPQGIGCSVSTFNARYPYDVDDILTCNSGPNNPGCFNAGPLKKNDSGLFGHAGADSIFHREIRLEEINPNEIKITVEIKWTTQEVIGERKITVVEHIFNWNEF